MTAPTVTKPQTIKVSIVEDDDRIRNSLSALIEGSDGFSCVSAHCSAEDALRHIPGVGPDVVLLDINLPQMSGIDCIQPLKSRLSSVKVLMHTVYEDEEQLFRALRAGADGYLLKRTAPAKLLEAIIEVREGKSAMSGHIARLVVKYFHQLGPVGETEKLTPREVEILRHLARGYQNKEIGDLLGIGFDTVRTHLRNIYEKLHVNSRTEAVMKYFGQ